MNNKGLRSNKGFFITGFQLGFVVFTTLMIGISQMPQSKRDFREKKAVEFGITYEDAKALSDDALLDLIRDDAPGSMNRVAYMKAHPGWRLGG